MLTNVLENHEKLKRYTHTLRLFILSRLLSFPATMRDLQILLRDSHEITVKMRDLLTRSITMTDLKISQAEAH